MSDKEPQSTPWKWPGEWLRDQNFWRDVATRALAGLIVVFVAWGVGVLSGVFSGPGALEAFANTSQVLAILAASVSAFFELKAGFSRARPLTSPDAPVTQPRNIVSMPRWMWLLSGLGTLLFAILLTLDFVVRVFLGGDPILFP